MRLAIVHERFTEAGGSEKVVEQLHAIWPDAPIFAAVVDRDTLPPGLRDADIRPSYLQRWYRGGSTYAYLLPALPSAFRRFDLAGYDAVITSHHAFANRVRPPADVPVVSYTHTPARWIWNADSRRGEWGGPAGRLALAAFSATQRKADRAAARRTRGIMTNSRAVAERVRCWWGCESTVVAPPVDVDRYTLASGTPREDFFLFAGRLVPYKRPLDALEAAQRAGVRTMIAGDGRLLDAVKKAAGPDVEVLGRVDDDELRDLYRRCRALLFPGDEDFGIVPVEAQACGAPVIAPAVGGVLDTVVDGVTGMLYPAEEGVDGLTRSIRSFDGSMFDARVIRRHAESFGTDRFRERVLSTVSDLLAQ